MFVFGSVRLGGDHAKPATAAVGLLDAAGVPVRRSAARVAAHLEAATLPDGAPLFPEVDPAASGDLGHDARPAWARMAPGPVLAGMLADRVPDRLDEAGLVELIKAHGRQIAFHEAQLIRATAELARRPLYEACGNEAEVAHDSLRAAADELSAAMRWSPRHADARVGEAVDLAEDLPATLAALEAGRIDAYRAHVIADETAALADEPHVRGRVEAAALRSAENRTGPQLRAGIKKTILEAAPERAEARRKAAHAFRRVDKPYPEPDGMASMGLHGPCQDLAALWTALDAAARARRDQARKADESTKDTAGGDAGKSLDQLRFDVLADLAWTGLHAGHLGCCKPDCRGAEQRLGSSHGRAAQVNVTVSISSLLELDDQPADLHGFGPVTAEVARRLAADAVWRRLLTDPANGSLLDLGTTRYRPSAHLAEFVMLRDRTCRFPTTTTPATASQLDHSIPHRPDGAGGATAADNLGPLSDRFHNARTHHGWELAQPQPGRFTWVSPAGFRYDIPPEVIGLVVDPPGDTNSDPPCIAAPACDPDPPGVYDEPPF